MAPDDRDLHSFPTRRSSDLLVMNAMRLGRPVKLPIEVQVSDNGPGIDPAVRDHIFEPFVSSKKNGQGLGLALVNKLVRDMNGRDRKSTRLNSSHSQISYAVF